MASRYLCSYCGLNHDYRQICPMKSDIVDKQKVIDDAEEDDVRRYQNMMLLAKTIVEARKRADIMERLENALREPGAR